MLYIKEVLNFKSWLNLMVKTCANVKYENYISRCKEIINKIETLLPQNKINDGNLLSHFEKDYFDIILDYEYYEMGESRNNHHIIG